MKRFMQIAATMGAVMMASAALAAEIKAPNFSLKDADGTSHSLQQYQGKVVVLEFTNPGSPVSEIGGCPYMIPRYEQRIMQGLAKQVADSGGVYLAVNSTIGNTAADSKAIADKYGVTHPTLLDTDGTVARAYQAKTTPHMFVISKDGNIVYDGALNSNNSPDPSKDATSEQYTLDAVRAAAKGETPKVTKTRSYGCAIKLK